MLSLIRLLGERAAHKTIARHVGHRGRFDIKLGVSLMRDRRVPIGQKLLAIVIGGGIVALLIALELPLEAAIGVLLPLAGVLLDGVADGLEATAGTLLAACLVLPSLVDAEFVNTIRAEQAEQYGVVDIADERNEPINVPRARDTGKAVGTPAIRG